MLRRTQRQVVQCSSLVRPVQTFQGTTTGPTPATDTPAASSRCTGTPGSLEQRTPVSVNVNACWTDPVPGVICTLFIRR